MVIKGHAVDTAVLGNVIDGDFGQRLFQQQILQRLLQGSLRYL